MKKLLMAAAGAMFVSLGAVTTARAVQLTGQTTSMGAGSIWSWVDVDDKGNPLSIGVSFTESALFGLPTTLSHDHNHHHDHSSTSGSGYGYLLADGHTPTFEYELLLPNPNEVSVYPFTHAAVNWNPQGHHPEEVYSVPHFDFHFNLFSPEERHAITAQGDDLARVYNLPSQEFWPVGYVPAVNPVAGEPGSEEPRMGLHWFNPDMVPNPGEFTYTYLYGSYNGMFNFWEPMITLDFLLTQPNITQAINLPTAYQVSGYYPSAYNINYNPDSQEYSVSLSGFEHREGVPEISPTWSLLALGAVAALSKMKNKKNKLNLNKEKIASR